MTDRLRYDELDWNAIWMDQKERSRRSKKESGGVHHWEEKAEAERYAYEADLEYQQRIEEEMAMLPVTSSSRVLDIGSGPGPLTIPLAKRAARVTAVEPARGMVEVLAERVASAGLTNVSWVQKTWEDTDLVRDLNGPFDLVIASFSLTMHDIRAALEKMDAASCGSVYLFDFVDGPLWERMAKEVWEELHGEPLCAGPKADIIWNILYQMGIYANVLMRPLEKVYRFSTLDEAVKFFGGRFGATGASQVSVVRSYLEAVNMAGDGSFLYRKESTYATIWWQTRQ